MYKPKTTWLYLDGKKHCDVVHWALGANMTLRGAKQHFVEYYGKQFKVDFKVQ